MRSIFIILVLTLNISVAQAQTLMGTTGWLVIPTADMQEDGTFFFGGSYLDGNYIKTYGGGEHNGITYYLNVTFLPFLEVSFGSTHLFKYSEGSHTVDRRFSFRLRAVRERKFIPAIVIGAHDAYSGIAKEKNTNQYFSSLYIVATKHIPVKKSEFGVTLGYGFDVFRNNQFLGFFGGISFSPSFLRQMTLIPEYDGQGFNLGGNILFFKHLFVYAMAQDVKYFSGGIAYRVYLLNRVKEKAKKRKNK